MLGCKADIRNPLLLFTHERKIKEDSSGISTTTVFFYFISAREKQKTYD
jgi:hypothetical protein